jgi:hypothetical protein
MTGIENFIFTVISSSGISVTLVAALVWFSRNWISERIRGSIQHEYDQKLAALNAELKISGDLQIESLRASVGREADRLRLAVSSFSEGQRAATERKLSALDKLWASILYIRENTPPIITYIDILTQDEYKQSETELKLRELQLNSSAKETAELFNKHIGSLEEARPYVGESIWGLFFIYRAILLRILYLLEPEERASRPYWYLDSRIKQLLDASFTKQEIDKLDQLIVWRIGYIQQKLESKILLLIDDIISGKQSSADAIQQAKMMEIKLSTLEIEGK